MGSFCWGRPFGEMGDLWGNSERPTLLPKLTDTYQDFSQREIKVFTQDYDNNSDRNGHVKMPVLLQGVRLIWFNLNYTKVLASCMY